MGYGVLIVEDEAILAKNIRLFLMRAGYDVKIAETAEDGLAQLEVFKPEVVLLDFNLPGMSGLQCLENLRAIDSTIKVVIITGHGNVELAVNAMKAGAYDFLTKPLSMSKLRLLLDKAIGEERQAHTLSYYRARDARESGFEKLIGESEAMTALRNTIKRVIAAEQNLCDTDAPAVLITGETGGGKELVARALHFNGPRRDKPFVEINCTSIPGPLLESELFGYERGAFTDARSRKLGLIETADGGTLFLDEIGDMEPQSQSKLLKLLEDKTVRRLGSVRDSAVNVRIIAATHQPLEELVAAGRFRSDLFFRLRIVHIAVPALRNRGSDILLLANHFLALHARRYGKNGLRLSAEVERQLLRHHWPGNVRELRNVIEHAVLMSSDSLIDALNLFAAPPARPSLSTITSSSHATSLAAVEREALCSALEKTNWNVSKAARVLGISRDTLRYRIEKFQLSSPQ
jgi:two-component system, NtrC family, response regulator AtoC